MTIDPLPTACPPQFPTFIVTLSQAAAAYRGELNQPRPTSAAVVSALLNAETAAKKTRLAIPVEKLLGQWRLCFTANRKAHQKAGTSFGKGFYVPKLAPAYISFMLPVLDSAADGQIGNQIQLGGLVFKLSGLFRYPGKKNLLAFDFLQMQLALFGKTIYAGEFRGGKAQGDRFVDQPIAKLPFFAFFLVTDDLIAARGRGGGLALWIRESDASSN